MYSYRANQTENAKNWIKIMSENFVWRHYICLGMSWLKMAGVH